MKKEWVVSKKIAEMKENMKNLKWKMGNKVKSMKAKAKSMRKK